MLPGAFYSQETGVGFAAYGNYTYPIQGTGPDTWSSSLTSAIVYTLKKQTSMTVWSSIYLGHANDWAIETEISGEHFPTNYFGVGPTTEASYQVFTRRQFRAENAVRRRVYEQLYVGLAHRFSAVDVRDVGAPSPGPNSDEVVWTDDTQLGSGNVTGENGTRTNGLGALVRWDTRDNNQSARHGALVDFELSAYPIWIGSTSSFVLSRADFRGYIPVGRGVIAGQWLTELGAGDIPFTAMSELGGDEMLRGMFQGRYRDKNSTTVQLELRHPIVWRFGAVAFISTGHVFPSFNELTQHAPRWTAGGGIRFVVDETARSNIRVDVGAGPDGTGFIFTFGEAF